MTRLRAPRIALIGLLLGLGAAAPAGDPHASQARIAGRDALRAAIAAMDAMTTRISMLTRVGGRVFYLERGPAARLVMRDQSGRQTVLIDHAAIDRFAASPDGSLVVISTGGLPGRVLQVIETSTGTARPDRIAAARVASLSWAPDGRSFFYTCASDANAPWRSERHVLGEDAGRDRVLLDADRLPFAFDGQPALVAVAAIPGSDFVIARVSDAVSGGSAFYAAPLASLAAATIPWTPVAALTDEVTAIAVRGARIDMLTRRDAPNGRIVEADLGDVRAFARGGDLRAFARGRTIVASGSGILTGLALARDGLYFARRDGATMSLLRLADAAPRPEIVTLPFQGTIAPSGAPAREDTGGLMADPRRPGADVGLQSWVQPLVWLHYDPRAHGVADLGIVPPFAHGLRPYQAVETTARARDGTLIALSIVSRRDTPYDGRRPLLLDSANTDDATFIATLLPWLDAGGVFAVAHVRGGDKTSGAAAGNDLTISDFIACAEALVARHLTDPAHLSAAGADGMPIGALSRRPDLFGADLFRASGVSTTRAPDDDAIADEQALLLSKMGAPGYQPP